MDEQAIAQRIIDLCTGSEGIITQLRSYRRLDQDKYQDVVSNIVAYHAALGTKDVISRTVVARLFELVEALDNAVYVSSEHQSPDYDDLETAQAEIQDIITELLTIPEKP